MECKFSSSLEIGDLPLSLRGRVGTVNHIRQEGIHNRNAALHWSLVTLDVWCMQITDSSARNGHAVLTILEGTVNPFTVHWKENSCNF